MSQIRLRRGLKVLFVDAKEQAHELSIKALVLALVDELPPGKKERFFENAGSIQRDLNAVADEDSVIIEVPQAT